MNFSLNFKFFLKSFFKPGSLEERLKLHYIPENAIKWPYTNSFDQDLTNQSEQADRDTPFCRLASTAVQVDFCDCIPFSTEKCYECLLTLTVPVW